jgi:hypothetical protein
MDIKYLVIVGTALLIGALLNCFTADKKKKYENSQANACGNGDTLINIFCLNQIQATEKQ